MLASASPAAGRSSELSATLTTASGRVFCKGITAESPSAWMHRNEVVVSPFLPEQLAPRLLWEIEVDGWLLLGFEHVTGRHANLSPDSADLPLIADAVVEISQTPAPPKSVAHRSMAAQWKRMIEDENRLAPHADTDPWCAANADLLASWAARAPEHMHGEHLIHSDLNPLNFLVSDRARVIDWAWWRTGAAWIDPAYLTIRLIAEGHDPEAAEKWAHQFDGFAEADPDAVTAYCASLVRMWGRKFPNTAPTKAARRWLRHRRV
ncbi:phosphotransferase [Actinosynnema sp. CA-248983]